MLALSTLYAGPNPLQRTMRGRISTAVTTLTLLGLATAISASEPWNVLPSGIGQKETFVRCIACHSTKIITQQGMTRAGWAETLEWMVDEQGMPELDSETHALILDYLTETFPPSRPHYAAPSD